MATWALALCMFLSLNPRLEQNDPMPFAWYLQPQVQEAVSQAYLLGRQRGEIDGLRIGREGADLLQKTEAQGAQ